MAQLMSFDDHRIPSCTKKSYSLTLKGLLAHAIDTLMKEQQPRSHKVNSARDLPPHLQRDIGLLR